MSDHDSIYSLAAATHSFERWGSRVQALKHLTLNVGVGEWVNVVGANGSGKSTLLNILAGNIYPSSGVALLSGRALNTLSTGYLRSKIFVIHQNPSRGTAPLLTVWEHLVVAENGQVAPKHSRGELRQRYYSTLEEFNLDAGLDQPVYTLSGGQRQLLAILIAKLRHTPILLLDEPFAALDPAKAQACIRAVKRLHSAGATIVLVSHDLGFAQSTGDRTIGLRDGRLIYDASGVSRDAQELSVLWTHESSSSEEPDARL